MSTTGDRRHIVITGAMGVGKTTVGRLLAEELDLPFADSDAILESRVGETSGEIAERRGVAALHQLELDIFLEVCRASRRSVIAPASSVVDHGEGRTAMSENLTVWLTAPDRVIASRQGSDSHRRPLDAAQRAALDTQREPHLEAVSSFSVDTASSNPGEVVQEILGSLG